jgi:hypothetical protein
MPKGKQKSRKRAYTHKINISADVDANTVKVSYIPSIKLVTLQDHQVFVNLTLAGMDMGLKELLGALPVLRPASAQEIEKSVYVFKDQIKDNKLYKERKQMYDTVANIIQNTLKVLFPDVEYIDTCTQNQQELIFDMTREEAEAYNAELVELTEAIRNPIVEEDEDSKEES